jgi:hypothetical protein
MESLEQELMTMLRRLPTPITITWRGGLYQWECAQGTGASSHLISAVEAALRLLLTKPTVQAGAETRGKGHDGPGTER